MIFRRLIDYVCKFGQLRYAIWYEQIKYPFLIIVLLIISSLLTVNYFFINKFDFSFALNSEV